MFAARMGLGHAHGAALLALWGGISLAGFGPQPAAGCGTLPGAFHRFAEYGGLPTGAADARQAQLCAACATLLVVHGMPESLYRLPDFARAPALDARMRHQELPREQLHSILAATTTAIFGSRPPARLEALRALVRASQVADAPLSPELDSLEAAIRHLAARHAVRDESHAAFMQTTTGGIRSLAGAAESSRTRELTWQLRQAAGLLQEAFLVLQASAEHYSDAGDTGGRLRLEEALGRLADVAAALESQSTDLAHALSRPAGTGADSVRMAAQAMQHELLRQERSLAGLQGTLASLEPAEVDQRPVQLMTDAAAVYGDVHGGMGALTEALTAELGNELQNYGTKTFVTLLLILAGFGLIRTAMWLLETISERSASRRLFYKRLIPVVRLTVWSMLLYVVLAHVFQLDQRSLFAAAAAVGVAIGFAAQNILKNIFGGIIIIFDQPFQVGDKIRVGGTYGEVVAIGLRATRIVTPEDSQVTVPNAQVIDTQIANANTGSLDCQVVVELFIPGWSDTAKAKAIAYSAAANSKYVFLGKPIVVNVQDVFKETFLTRLAIKAYVLDTRHEFAFASEVTETAKAEFKRQGYFAQLETGSSAAQAP